MEQARQEADCVISLSVRRADGHPLPKWAPGAHVDVLMGSDLVRLYSLSPAPADDAWRIVVLCEQDGRGGSTWLHDRVRPGDTLLVAAPRNNVVLDPDGDRYVFVAGGMGITPLLPMVVTAGATGKDWTLLYLGRSESSMAFTEVLQAYGSKVVLHRDSQSGSSTPSRRWTGYI